MLIPTGVLLALVSAVVWGGGDFTGGYAARRASQYHVLALSALSGLVILAAAALILRESLPSLRGALYAALAGLSGAVGIAALYRALSLGHAAGTAPTTAVIGAVLPVLFGIFTHGFPGPLRLVGFALALAGIWLVSAVEGESAALHSPAFRLACLAGVGFGAFFIFIGLVEPGKIFTPLILARFFTLLTGLALIRLNRLPLPALTASPYALLAGCLDAGGNLFYILAKQYTRLDIAAVISSLYPASTVMLAAVLLKEKIGPRQWIGVVICLAAIVLITL